MTTPPKGWANHTGSLREWAGGGHKAPLPLRVEACAYSAGKVLSTGSQDVPEAAYRGSTQKSRNVPS